MSIKSKLAYWCLPPGFKKLIHRYIRPKCTGIPGVDFDQLKRILMKNKSLKDKHRGKRCFILLTGPSIANQDLRPLSREITLACSRFFLHSDIDRIKPDYYVQADWHAPISEEEFVQTLKDAYKTMPQAIAILGTRNIPLVRKSDVFRESDIYYYHGSVSTERLETIALHEAALKPQSVSVMAIYIGVYMGFSEIFLLGCDHDWIATLEKPKHFYNEDEAQYSASWPDLHFRLRGWANLWAQYKALERIARRQGTKIINATENSLLDVYPIVPYQQIVD